MDNSGHRCWLQEMNTWYCFLSMREKKFFRYFTSSKTTDFKIFLLGRAWLVGTSIWNWRKYPFYLHFFHTSLLLPSESRNTYKICNHEETLFVQLIFFFFKFFQIANYLPQDEDLDYPSKLERSDVNSETTSVRSFVLQLIYPS